MRTWYRDEKQAMAAEKLERFILEQKWEDFPQKVRERAVACSVDLIGTMIACAGTQMAKKGMALATKIYPQGDIPVIGAKERMSMMGAVMAYGYNVNALDLDDGHNLIKGHPGAVIIAGILPAALDAGVEYKEFLTALVVGYEIAVRAGLALHKYYGFYHGTGSWGAFGAAAAIARLRKADREILSNALSIADYQGPLSPVMRVVAIPSMNKDGIACGALTGAMAVEAAQCGITGRFYNLLEDENQYLIQTLGRTYEIMNIYFKRYPCCRWAQAPVRAVLELREKYRLKGEEIKKIKIYTFRAAVELSSKIPERCDEAQYNIIYPVCVALVKGEFLPVHDSEEFIQKHPQIIKLMEKVEYEVKEEFESWFPQKRFAQVEVVTDNGRHFISDIVQPWGEKEESIGIGEILEKQREVLVHSIRPDVREKILNRLTDEKKHLVWEALVEEINGGLLRADL